MTQTEAVNWLKNQVGQYRNYDGLYGNQCVDLFNFYYQFVTGRNPYSDGYGVPGAKDLWGINTNLFTKIPDSSTLEPQPGDVLIYGASWGGGWGHVEMVEYTNANGCGVIGNNMLGNPTAPATRAFRTWAGMRGLIGVMRPKWQATNNTGGSTVDTIKSMYWRLLGREADQGGIDTYINAANARGWEFVYNDLKNSGEGQADWTRRNPERVGALEAGIQARDVRIQELQTALANEQSKPPREVIKEVEKIVEKPIEVVKEVPVYTHDQATADTVQATSKTVNSIKGMLVNFIGYVKGKLGK